MNENHPAGALLFLRRLDDVDPARWDDPDREHWEQYCLERGWAKYRRSASGGVVLDVTKSGGLALLLHAHSTAPQPEPEPTITERDLERIAQAVGDDSTVRVMAVAGRKDWSGERRMEEILRLDRRFAGKDSAEWAKLLDVSPAAVRGYDLWKRLRRAARSDD